MDAQQRFNKKMPVLCFRVEEDVKDRVDEVVKGRRKYESDFSRQKYLNNLLQVDLKKLEMT